MSSLAIILAVLAALVLLTFLWGARNTRSMPLKRDELRRRRNREDPL
jgi:hypothetical protein